MLPDKDIGCHRTGFTRKCRDLVASGECNRYIQILGLDPNTGGQVNKWDCIDNWQPMLIIDNSQQQRQTAAAVESFRNEMVKMNGATTIALLGQPPARDLTVGEQKAITSERQIS